jgi:uncharacterized membrane protein YedE/YeeE
MPEFIVQPWPWYISGPLIGLIVPMLLLLTGKQFGISSSFRHICAACSGPNTSIEFLRYEWRDEQWNLFFVAGIILGGFIAMRIFSADPVSLLPQSAGPALTLQLLIGGFMIGFGSRYAGGCTSGHAIMGLASLQKASLVAVISFFAGGIIMQKLLTFFQIR